MQKTIRLRKPAWLAAAIIAFTCAATFLWYFRLPMCDDYTLLPYLEKWYDGTLTFGDLLHVQAGHWLLTGFLLQVPIEALSRWNTFYTVAVSLLLLFWAWWYVVRILRRTGARLDSQAFYAAALPLLAFVLWSLDQSGNLFWGWQVSVFWSVLSACAVVFYLSEPTLAPRPLALALVFSTLGVYGYGASFAMLPVALLLIALHPGAGRRRKCLYGALWLAYIALVSWHYLSNRSGEVDSLTLRSPLFYADFTVHFIGSAVARFAGNAAVFLSVAITLALVARSLVKLHRAGSLAESYPYLAFLLFGVGAGLLTAYGRSDFGIGQSGVSRYITFANFFWLGAFAVLLMTLSKEDRYAKLTVAVIVCLVLMKSFNSFQVTRKNVGNTVFFSQAASELAQSYPDLPPGFDYKRMYLWPEAQLKDDLTAMHRYGLTPFRR